jgi:DNA repair exonuclease SbcCD ATPase subunit
MSNMKFRTILENVGNIPNTHAQAAKFNDKPTLTKEEKRNLMNKVGRYNEYSNVFALAQEVVKTANELSEIAKLGKTYAMNECDEWLQTDTINRDFKGLDKIVQEFTKLSKECYGNLERLRVLYEDAGHVLERYYEIKDFNPTTGMSSTQLPPDESPMEEIIPNESPRPMKLSELDIKW